MRRPVGSRMRLFLSVVLSYLIACLIATLSGALVPMIIAATSADTVNWSDFATFAPQVVAFVLALAPVPIALTVPIGAPAIYLLERRGLRSPLLYGLAGMIASLPLSILLAWSWPIDPADLTLGAIVLGCGLIGGCVYRLMRRITFDPAHARVRAQAPTA